MRAQVLQVVMNGEEVGTLNRAGDGAMLIRPYYDVQADQQTGLIKTSWFDDLITLKLKGVLYLGKAIITRLHQWRLEQAVGRSSPLLGVL